VKLAIFQALHLTNWTCFWRFLAASYSLSQAFTECSPQNRGRHVIQFCESAPCHVAGGREVWNSIKELLKIEEDQTTLMENGRYWPQAVLDCVQLVLSCWSTMISMGTWIHHKFLSFLTNTYKKERNNEIIPFNGAHFQRPWKYIEGCEWSF